MHTPATVADVVYWGALVLEHRRQSLTRRPGACGANGHPRWSSTRKQWGALLSGAS